MQVEPYRPWYRREKRAAVRVVAISLATLTASAGLFVWTSSSWIRGSSRSVARDESTSSWRTELPAELPADGPATALLAADDPIGEPVERLLARDGAPVTRGVAAAADRYGVIALWTDRVLWVSRDDGRSFHQELAAPEPITAAAVGPDGRVYAARHGGRLGVLSPDGVTRWLDISGDQLLAIDAGIEMPVEAESPGVAPTAAPAPAAPWLAVLGLHADSADGLSPILWLSGDHGRSWRRLIAPHHGDASNQIRVGPTGVIDLVTVDGDSSAAAGASGRLRHYTGHVDGRPFALRFASDEPPPLALGHDGHGWRLEWDGGRMRLIDGSSHLPLAVRNWDVRVAASREHTYSVADGRLVELGAGRPRPVTHSVPGAIDALAVDGLGRALAVVGDTAVRYSKRHGWRRLFEIPPP